MVSVFTVLAATEETAGIAALGIDPWAILIQGTTFLIFLLIVKKFAFGKIVSTLEDRRKSIEGSLDKAEELQKQNEEAEKRVNELLHEARLQAEELITKGRAEADGIVTAAQTEADTKAKKIIAEGLAKIDQQVEKAQDDLKKQTLELVAEATAALLSEKVDAKKNNELIKKALKESK
ncbi:F0F1 ATP synthase subunit B [Candidatus Saccharibacteria bacterium]|nr:F0F1 ATP synthase subunit B [Candidatus Saccharibacteria bacterium]